MLLAYLDESYSKPEVYWLGAALVPERAVDVLGHEYRRIPATIPRDLGVPPDAELHGYDLYGGEGAFASIKHLPSVITKTYRKALRALAEAGPELLFAGVDWCTAAPRASVEAHRLYVFSKLLPAIEARCEALDERCVVLADREETTAEDVLAALHAHRSQCHTDGHECRILEAVFVDSHHCAGVQAADLATYVFQRRASGRETDARGRVALEGFWSICSPFVKEQTRHAEPPQWPTGTIEFARSTKKRLGSGLTTQ